MQLAHSTSHAAVLDAASQTEASLLCSCHPPCRVRQCAALALQFTPPDSANAIVFASHVSALWHRVGSLQPPVSQLVTPLMLVRAEAVGCGREAEALGVRSHP
eukprot:2925828-Rhodomonas_salina.2